LSFSEKKKFLHQIIGEVIVLQPQFFYEPIAKVLTVYPNNYGDIFPHYTVKFEKWYEPSGYQRPDIDFPQRREGESEYNYNNRYKSYQRELQLHALLGLWDNNEYNIIK
jgi:hypothetical protein